MARIPTINRLVTEDFGEQKDWIGKLLQPLNTFMASVVSALNRGITLEENVDCRLKEITLRYDTDLPVLIRNEFNRRPKGVLVLRAVTLDSSSAESTPIASSVAWELTSDNMISLTAFTGMSTSTYYKVLLLIL